jgi:hypothetical protein
MLTTHLYSSRPTSETHTLNRHRASLIALVTLVTLAITPAAVAQIYKCDGPDGPVYSDKKCGPDAANVEVRESSGLSGVTEQDKINLAEKKQEREKARGQNQQGSVINNQSNTYTTESPGRWVRGRYLPRDRDKPSTLPVKPRPATPRKRR